MFVTKILAERIASCGNRARNYKNQGSERIAETRTSLTLATMNMATMNIHRCIFIVAGAS
jgi:hypothetical protein